MKKLRTLIPVLLLIALLTGTGLFAQGSTTDSLVRFAHAIPGAAAIDVYVDGELTIANLDFGQASNYISAPATDHQITVTPAGATTSLWEQAFTPGAGRAFTLVASSFDEPVSFTSFEDILEPLPLGKSRFTTIHAIADGPAVRYCPGRWSSTCAATNPTISHMAHSTCRFSPIIWLWFPPVKVLITRSSRWKILYSTPAPPRSCCCTAPPPILRQHS